MTEMDWSVGQMIQKLKQLKIEDDTFVFFSSDNGPDLARGIYGGTAGSLSCGKGSVFEGGVRVSAMGWWPGHIARGRLSAELASTMDLFPTLLSIAGIPPPSDGTIDGKDLSPILFHGKPSLTKALFHYQGNSDVYAVTYDTYKAHFKRAGWGNPPLCGPKTPEVLNPPLLFEVERDPSEQYPISSNSTVYQNVIAYMRLLLAQHKAQMVYGKPQFDMPNNPDVMPCCNKQTKCVCGQTPDKISRKPN